LILSHFLTSFVFGGVFGLSWSASLFWFFLSTHLIYWLILRHGESLAVPTWLHASSQIKVHKDMDEWVWCGGTWLAWTESWPQPDRTPLGWIRAVRASPSCPTSVPNLTNVLQEEWSTIPINTLLNLVESLLRVEAVIAAKRGPTPYK